jgi:hypothetical protein
MSLLEFGWSSMRRPGASREPDNRSLDCGQRGPLIAGAYLKAQASASG